MCPDRLLTCCCLAEVVLAVSDVLFLLLVVCTYCIFTVALLSKQIAYGRRLLNTFFENG